MGEPADIASKFKCNEELGWKAATVKIFKPADLAGLKSAGIPEQFFHLELTLVLPGLFSGAIIFKSSIRIEESQCRHPCRSVSLLCQYDFCFALIGIILIPVV